MSEIKWKPKIEIEAEQLAKEQAKFKKEKYKGRDIKTLSSAEKDELFETLCVEHGLL